MQAPFHFSSFAKNLGWDAFGITEAQIPEERAQFFTRWLRRLEGLSMKYLSKRSAERLNPQVYFSGAQSVLVFGLYYFPGWSKGEVKVSNYAWSKDYHEVLKEKLKETEAALIQEMGPFKSRLSVDTSPVLEKVLAEQAGLGWQGKNTLLLNEKFGSYLFLGTLITDLPKSIFMQNPAYLPASAKNRCGTCTRCIDACPTQALEAFELEPSKCIAYWNLEHRGEFTEKTPASFHGWAAGCDICQEVCPWNADLIALQSESSKFAELKKSEIEDASWHARIKNTALNYVPPENWIRNLSRL